MSSKVLMSKMIALGLVFVTGLIGGFLPLRLKANKNALAVGNALAGGVFLSAGIVHMAADSIEDLGYLTEKIKFPIANLLICIGFILVLFIEKVALKGHDALIIAAVGDGGNDCEKENGKKGIKNRNKKSCGDNVNAVEQADVDTLTMADVVSDNVNERKYDTPSRLMRVASQNSYGSCGDSMPCSLDAMEQGYVTPEVSPKQHLEAIGFSVNIESSSHLYERSQTVSQIGCGHRHLAARAESWPGAERCSLAVANGFSTIDEVMNEPISELSPMAPVSEYDLSTSRCMFEKSVSKGEPEKNQVHMHRVKYYSRLFGAGVSTGVALTDHLHDDDAHAQVVELDSQTESSFLPYLLLAVLSIHSFITGLTLGFSEKNNTIVVVLIAIVAHKLTAAIALGVNMLKENVERKRYIKLVVLFSLTTPLGIGVGAALTNELGSAGKTVSAVCEAIGAGTFIYIAGLIISEEFAFANQKWYKFAALIIGFSAMTSVAIIS